MTKLEAEKIYVEYKEKVERYISAKVKNRYDVEDLVSSVFLKVYRSKESFDNRKASVSTWIYAITRNTVIDYFRKCKEIYPVDFDVVDENDSYEGIVEEDILSDLADALVLLEPKQRDLIILHYYDGKTLKNIAAEFGMSYINIKIMHKKALRFLKTKLG